MNRDNSSNPNSYLSNYTYSTTTGAPANKPEAAAHVDERSIMVEETVVRLPLVMSMEDISFKTR